MRVLSSDIRGDFQAAGQCDFSHPLGPKWGPDWNPQRDLVPVWVEITCSPFVRSAAFLKGVCVMYVTLSCSHHRVSASSTSFLVVVLLGWVISACLNEPLKPPSSLSGALLLKRESLSSQRLGRVTHTSKTGFGLDSLGAELHRMDQIPLEHGNPDSWPPPPLQTTASAGIF